MHPTMLDSSHSKLSRLGLVGHFDGAASQHVFTAQHVSVCVRTSAESVRVLRQLATLQLQHSALSKVRNAGCILEINTNVQLR